MNIIFRLTFKIWSWPPVNILSPSVCISVIGCWCALQYAMREQCTSVNKEKNGRSVSIRVIFFNVKISYFIKIRFQVRSNRVGADRTEKSSRTFTMHFLGFGDIMIYLSMKKSSRIFPLSALTLRHILHWYIDAGKICCLCNMWNHH